MIRSKKIYKRIIGLMLATVMSITPAFSSVAQCEIVENQSEAEVQQNELIPDQSENDLNQTEIMPEFATGQLSWGIELSEIEHESVTVKVSETDKAQTAKFIYWEKPIVSGNSVSENSISFEIKNRTQKVKLNLPVGSELLSEVVYEYVIENAAGIRSKVAEMRGPKHTGMIEYLSPDASDVYPEAAILRFKQDHVNVFGNLYGEVGFKKYEGVLQENSVLISYPRQEVGDYVEIIWEDEFGCSCKDTYQVKSDVPAFNSADAFKACRDGVLMKNVKISPNYRMKVMVGDQEYLGEYGFESKENNLYQYVVEYPLVKDEKIESVKVQLLGIYGDDGPIIDVPFSSADLGEKSVMNAYPYCLEGKLEEDSLGHKITSIKVEIGEESYSEKIAADGSFVISYPKQEIDKEVSVSIVDEAGCKWDIEKKVQNDPNYFNKASSVIAAFPNHLQMKLAEGEKAYVKIGESTYSQVIDANAEKEIDIIYKAQKPGTAIQCWTEDKRGCYSKVENMVIPNREYQVETYAEVTYMEGLFWKTKDATKDEKTENDNDADDDEDDDEKDINLNDDAVAQNVNASVIIDGKSYTATVTKASEEQIAKFRSVANTDVKEEDDDSKEENDEDLNEGNKDLELYYYRATYPQRQIGETVKLLISDSDGYVVENDVLLDDIELNVKVDTIDSSTTKIVGTTRPYANVKVKVGKKKYSGKAGKTGVFKIKIKPQKTGTAVAINVTSKEGYKGEYSTKIRKVKSKFTSKGNLYKNSTSVKYTITNVRKGDVITLTVGNDVYTKKVKAAKKKQTFVFNLNKTYETGTKVKISIADSFKTVKLKASQTVYSAKVISVGMRAEEINYTTYGKPVQKKSHGWMSEWIYKVNDKKICVWIENGVVTSVEEED